MRNEISKFNVYIYIKYLIQLPFLAPTCIIIASVDP
jgi:hypothetical protein